MVKKTDEIITELNNEYEKLLKEYTPAQQLEITKFKGHIFSLINSILQGQSAQASSILTPYAPVEVSVAIAVTAFFVTGITGAVIGGATASGLTSAYNTYTIAEAQRLCALFGKIDSGTKVAEAFCLQAILYHHKRIVLQEFESDDTGITDEIKNFFKTILRAVVGLEGIQASDSHMLLALELLRQFLDGLAQAEMIFNHAPDSAELISYIATVPEVISKTPISDELNFTGSYKDLNENKRYIIALEAARLTNLADEHKAIIDRRANEWGYESGNNTLFYKFKDTNIEGGIRCVAFSNDNVLVCMLRGPKGVYRNVKNFFNATQTYVASIYEELKEHFDKLQSRNIQRIIFTGHGAGGALAVSMGSIFYKDHELYRDKITIMTFGQLATSYTKTPGFENCVYRFLNREDRLHEFPVNIGSAITSHIDNNKYVITNEKESFAWSNLDISNSINPLEIYNGHRLRVYRSRLMSHARSYGIVLINEPISFSPSIDILNKLGKVVFSPEFSSAQPLEAQYAHLKKFGQQLVKYFIETGGLGYMHPIQNGSARVEAIAADHIKTINDSVIDRSLKLSIIFESKRIAWWLKLLKYQAKYNNADILTLVAAILNKNDASIKIYYDKLIEAIEIDAKYTGQIFVSQDTEMAPLLLIQSIKEIAEPKQELNAVVTGFKNNHRWVIILSLLEHTDGNDPDLNNTLIIKIRSMMDAGDFTVFKEAVAAQEWILEDYDQVNISAEKIDELISSILSTSIQNLNIINNQNITDYHLSTIVERLPQLETIKIEKCPRVKAIENSTISYYTAKWDWIKVWADKPINDSKKKSLTFINCENLNQSLLDLLGKLMSTYHEFKAIILMPPQNWEPIQTLQFARRYPDSGIPIGPLEEMPQNNVIPPKRPNLQLASGSVDVLDTKIPEVTNTDGFFILMQDASLAVFLNDNTIIRRKNGNGEFPLIQKIEINIKKTIAVILLRNGSLISISENGMLCSWKLIGGVLCLDAQFMRIDTTDASSLFALENNHFYVYSEKRKHLSKWSIENNKLICHQTRKIDSAAYAQHLSEITRKSKSENPSLIDEIKLHNFYRLLSKGLLTDAHIPLLLKNDIAVLDVSHSKITDDNLRVILEKYPNLKLQNINIEGCYFLSEKTLVLKKILNDNKNEPADIKDMTLTNHGLNDDELLDVLADFPNLESLTLRTFNHLTGACIEKLEQKGLKSLTFIDCRNLDLLIIKEHKRKNSQCVVTYQQLQQDEQIEACHFPNEGGLILPICIFASSEIKCLSTTPAPAKVTLLTYLPNRRFACISCEKDQTNIAIYTYEFKLLHTQPLDRIVNTMTVSSKGELCLGTNSGAFSYKISVDNKLDEGELGGYEKAVAVLLEVSNDDFLNASGNIISYWGKNDNNTNSEFTGSQYAINSERCTYGESITALAKLSNGNIISGSANGLIIRYSLKNKELFDDEMQFTEDDNPSSKIINLLTLPGNILISVTAKGTITTWQLQKDNLKKINQLKTNVDMLNAVLSPEGGLLCLTSKGLMQYWKCIDYASVDHLDEEELYLHNARQLLERNILYLDDVKKIFPSTTTKSFDISNTLIRDDLLEAILNHCPKIKINAVNCLYLTHKGYSLVARRVGPVLASSSTSSESSSLTAWNASISPAREQSNINQWTTQFSNNNT